MTILKNILIIFFLSIFINELAFSQDIDTEKEKPEKENIKYPNIVKVNSFALAFQNMSLVYERGIIPNLSAGIGVGYKYAGTLPKLFSVNQSVVGVNLDKIKGISITPEARYYVNSCDPSQLEGFYAGVYLRYTGYNSAANFEYLPESKPAELYQADIALREYGIGIQLGYQLLIKERFSIDFLLFGPRFSSYRLAYEFDQQPSEEFLGDLSEYLNEVVDRLGFDYEVNIERDGEKKANTSFSFANARFGLSLGFAF